MELRLGERLGETDFCLGPEGVALAVELELSETYETAPFRHASTRGNVAHWFELASEETRDGVRRLLEQQEIHLLELDYRVEIELEPRKMPCLLRESTSLLKEMQIELAGPDLPQERPGEKRECRQEWQL
jgi:hypothetical protein